MRRLWFALLGVAASGADLPQRVIQYGAVRTASTLLYQELCVVFFLVHGEHGDVSCSFRSPGKYPPLPSPRKRRFDVLKMHRPPLSDSHNSRVWVFATTNATGDAAALDAFRARGFPVKLVQATDELARRGHQEFAARLADVFDLGSDDRRALYAYVRSWKVLRQCCGPQMSQDWYRELLRRAGTAVPGPPHHARDSPSYPACEIYDLDAVEAALLATAVVRRFGARAPMLRRVSQIDGDLNGTYCSAVNARMAATNTGAETFKERVGIYKRGRRPPGA